MIVYVLGVSLIVTGWFITRWWGYDRLMFERTRDHMADSLGAFLAGMGVAILFSTFYK